MQRLRSVIERQAPLLRAPSRRWLAWTLLCGCVLAAAAHAESATAPVARTENVIELDIAAQNLASALDVFSRLTGLAVLVDRDLTRGRRSMTVKGRYSPRQALSLLLMGSGLMARYARDDAFTLQVAQVSRPAPPREAKSGGTGASYASKVQRAIEGGLCAQALTRPGTYRAVLQVWIGPRGNIQHSRLLASTGNAQRDDALVQRLENIRVAQSAPSSLGQPVTLLLLPDSTGKGMDCTALEGAGEV